MAIETTVTFVDDIDGSTEGVEHYTFTWLGTDYEMDLAPKSAKKLVEVMNSYTDKATVVRKPKANNGARGGRTPARATATREEMMTIRGWAREQGMEVSDRGRISEAIKDAYDQAHQAK